MKKSRYSQHSYLEDGELLHKMQDARYKEATIEFYLPRKEELGYIIHL